ncbi:MAG: aspartyl protease family protein [Dehalococcoidia bacterium]
MGTFNASFEVGDRDGQRWESVEALVDTGASYTWIPKDVLERLGIKPEFSLEFETADGRIIERGAAETFARLNGTRRTTVVVFGDEASRALLGAYTMEGFSVAPDPVNKRLVRVRGLAMRALPATSPGRL